MATVSFQDFVKQSGGKSTDVKTLGLPSAQSETPSFTSRVGTDIKTAGSDIANTITDNSKSPLQRGINATETALATPLKVASEVLPQGVRDVLTQLGKNAGGAIEKIGGDIGKLPAVVDFVKNHPDFSKALEQVTSLGQGTGNIAMDILATEGGAKIGNKALDVAKTATDATVQKISNAKGTIDNLAEKFSSPEVSEATKVSLNPKEALKGTGQDIQVSVGGKLKNLSEITPDETTQMQVSTQKALDTFTTQAQKFAKDRSVVGGSPVEVVGTRADKALTFADKKRQVIGQKMGDIELKYVNDKLPIGEKSLNTFSETIKSFDNPKYGVDTAEAPVVRKLITDFDTLEKGGATIGERLDFIRSWDKYLRDSKDAFGNFKENATANTRIQNAVKVLKDETVDAVSTKDKVYRNLRTQYRTYKQLDEIGNSLLGKEGALGQRIKGASLIKRAIQSNSDAGARQFLIKLKELTGYDAIKEGDLALTAMENAGDYQGLSLLNIVKEGKSGLINRGLEWARNRTVGNNVERVKKYIKK